MTIIQNIIGALFNSIYHLSITNKFADLKFKNKRKNYLIAAVVLTVLILINYFLINKFVEIPMLIIFLLLVNFIFFKNSFINSLCIAITSQAIIMLTELLFSIVFMAFITSDVTFITSNAFGTLIINFIICVLATLIGRTRLSSVIYNFLKKITINLSNKITLLFFIIILFSINFLFVSLYYQVDSRIFVLINTIISIIYVIIVFRVFSIENKYVKMSTKYNTTLSSLKEYEEILDKYKIMNHENKNDLLMIRNMIIKKDKDVDKYIDKLIDVKIKDDEKAMYETSIIPSGGLRAVIYSKILIMKDRKVKNKLHVDKAIRGVDLTDYSDEFVLDLCKILNIYMDNAIEAAEQTKKKEVLIQLFLDSKDNFNISITNTYSGSIDETKIGTKGYTTKGDGHGYGLTLANQLLSKHNKMTNTRKITNKTFTQTIVIENK